MRTLRLQLLILLLAAGAARGEIPDGWNSDYRASLAQAKTNQQPVLIYFTASWCGPCKRMARTTFKEETILKVLEPILHLALDIDEQPILAEQHGIRAVPTFQIVLSSGTPVATLTGFQEPAPLIEWLTNNLVLAKATIARQEQFTRQFAAAELLLQQTDSAARSNAISGLLELCAGPGEGLRDKASARLSSLPPEDLPWVLQGLNHPALAVRIQAANLMRVRAGDVFDIDPWSDAATRQKSVTEWRARMPSLNLK